MKYAVSTSFFRGGNLVTSDIVVVKASDPTILKDTMFKVLSIKSGIDYRKLTSSRMGLLWDHNNNPNNRTKGAFKIFQYLKDKEEYWVCFYRAIRESDTLTAEEEEETE